MSNLGQQQGSRNVAIFWDIENCAVPSGRSGIQMAHGLEDIAREFGPVKYFSAYQSISETVPSIRVSTLRADLSASGVQLVDCPHQGRKEVVDRRIIVDMLCFALDNLPSNVVIVLVTADQDYCYSVSVLRRRGYDVVLITPARASNQILRKQASRVIALNYPTYGNKQCATTLSRHETGHLTPFTSRSDFPLENVTAGAPAKTAALAPLSASHIGETVPMPDIQSYMSANDSPSLADDEQELEEVDEAERPDWLAEMEDDMAHIVGFFDSPSRPSDAQDAADVLSEPARTPEDTDTALPLSPTPMRLSDAPVLSNLPAQPAAHSADPERLVDPLALPAHGHEANEDIVARLEGHALSRSQSLSPSKLSRTLQTPLLRADVVLDFEDWSVSDPERGVQKKGIKSPTRQIFPPSQRSAATRSPFDPLLKTLERLSARGNKMPQWGVVGSELGSQKNECFHRAGTDSFKGYLKAAQGAGLVELGEISGGGEWVALKAERPRSRIHAV